MPATDTNTAQPSFYPEDRRYTIDLTLSGDGSMPNQILTLDGDAPFQLIALYGTQAGAYTLDLEYPNGRKLSSAPLINANVVGTAQFPVPLLEPKIWPAGGHIRLSFVDKSHASNTLQLVLLGCKLYPVPTDH